MASTIYPFAADLTKQAPRGIAKVYVKKAADTGYSSLGDIRNGKAHVRLTGTQNSRKRTNPFAAIAEHEFEMLQCSLTEMELLDTLIAGDVDVIIQCIDGQCYVHNAAATRVGIWAKPTFDAKIDSNRFITIRMKVGLLSSEIDTVVPAVNPSITAPADTDTFWAIANPTGVTTNPGKKENVRPSGVSTAEICALSESSYDDMGEVSNTTFTMEPLGRETDKLRYRTIGFKIDGSFEQLQDSSTEKGALDLFHTNGANLKLTYYDGLILTLADKVGVIADEGFDGDFDDHKTIKYTIDGSILVSELDGIVSAA